MTMREKLARAMWERIRERDNPKIGHPDYLLPPWEDETDELRANWIDLAGVALGALMEPDEGMISDGAFQIFRGQMITEDDLDAARRVWRAMTATAARSGG